MLDNLLSCVNCNAIEKLPYADRFKVFNRMIYKIVSINI